MQDSMQTPQAPPIQPSSIPSSAPVSPAVTPSTSVATASPSQPMMAAPASAPVAPWPAAPAPQVAPMPQAEPAVNPWQEAYQRLAAGMSATPASQPPAVSWPTTPQPQSYAAAPVSAPVNSPAPAVSYGTAPSVSAPAIWPQQATAAYPSAPQTMAQPSAEVSDGYLGGVSNESLEVLGHFGAEAPALLNRYSCAVEDALLAQAQQSLTALQVVEKLQQDVGQLQTLVGAAGEQITAYNKLLTDPDLLADYVNDFYGPNGPCPVETARDRLQAEVEAGGYGQVSYQRPQLEMPAPASQVSSDPSRWWETFNAVSERNPEMLWRMLEQAPGEALRAKLLVSES